MGLLEGVNIRAPHAAGVAGPARGDDSARAAIAVISNPLSDGNKVHRGRVRQFCATRPEIVHFEIVEQGDLEAALDRIAASDFRAIAINGGDGTVQGVLTRLFGDDAPARTVPPIAVLPSGRTNLIAKDLGATGDPIAALERLIALTAHDLRGHLVKRQLIALDTGRGTPAMGMFFAAGALADTLLYCRHKLYPLKMPNWLAHLLTVIAGLVSVLTNSTSRFLPPMPREASVTIGGRTLRGRFQVLMVSTLQALVLTGRLAPPRDGSLGLVAMERRRSTVFRSVFAGFVGKVGHEHIPGLHFEAGTEISLGAELADAIMDGESFRAAPGHGILLRAGASVRFVDLTPGARIPMKAGDEAGFSTAPVSQLATLSPLWNSHSRP
jgi:diacylglycerol kinase family enzyme